MVRDALDPGNGGHSGSGYLETLSPCSSEDHSTLSYRQDSQLALLSVLPVQRVLFLFTAFGYLIGRSIGAVCGLVKHQFLCQWRGSSSV